MSTEQNPIGEGEEATAKAVKDATAQAVYDILVSTPVGERIGAVLASSKHRVLFLGYGTYVGGEVPPEEVGGFNFGQINPKLKLDNDDIVWGCECWWGPEEKMRKAYEEWKADGRAIYEVRIADYRKKS